MSPLEHNGPDFQYVVKYRVQKDEEGSGEGSGEAEGSGDEAQATEPETEEAEKDEDDWTVVEINDWQQVRS